MSATFQQWAENAQQVAEAPDEPTRIALAADYFRSLNSDTAVRLAAQFLGEGPLPALSEKRATVGSRTYSTCVARFCEVDYEKVFKPCKKAIGSATEAIEKLMENIETAREKRDPTNLDLVDISESFKKLPKRSSRAGKQEILRNIWHQMTPVEIKFYIRIVSQKSPGIGLGEQQLITALANAFDQETKEVRYAHTITGSIGKTAVLCKKDALDNAQFALFHPLPFMFASSSGDNLPHDLNQYVAEENFSGLRTQVHISGKKVKMYTDDGDDISRSFPEIIQFFAKKELPKTVLDGQICIFKNNEIHPSQTLQKRLKHEMPPEDIRNKLPAIFIACDLLYIHPDPTVNLPLDKRRKKLETLAGKYHFLLVISFRLRMRKISISYPNEPWPAVTRDSS
jgi:DNA ligase-1